MQRRDVTLVGVPKQCRLEPWGIRHEARKRLLGGSPGESQEITGEPVQSFPFILYPSRNRMPECTECTET